MIVIADSGSTKTDWRLIKSPSEILAESTIGLNPFNTSEEVFIETIREAFVNRWAIEEVVMVFFYSAGIVDEERAEQVAGWIHRVFNNAKAVVNSDLTAAGRALFGNNRGVAGILGTGSNSGFFNGKSIDYNISPLGYILGDEGSGSALGKALLKLILRNDATQDLRMAFLKFYPEKERILENVYNNERSAEFLASFVPFLLENRNNEQIATIISEEIGNFLKLLNKYPPSEKFGLVGSIAYLFSEEIKILAAAHDIQFERIIKSPIDDLVNYHLKERK